ncbi:hypothetical protein BDN70DRAFT_926654 [Pholiota conissans]|uniref:Uncharacterized protein n=1 Tax=Pholiota conissans TaxID=109636 RepID=A0A9P5ZE55_9AGAR|nr:hypothetical protein BDN70DRAFT_926654 [Pholiota conissans]
MKIPTSSSIFLTSLAISSSSSCLAAPAGAQSQATEVSNPTSASQFSYMPSASATPSRFGSGHDDRIAVEGSHIVMERDVAQHLEARELLGPVVKLVQGLPMIGSLLGNILLKLDPDGKVGAQSTDSDVSDSALSQQDFAALQSAIQEVSRVLNAAYAGNVAQDIPGVPSSILDPASGVVGGTPASQITGSIPIPSGIFGAQSDGGDSNSASGSSSSAYPGVTQSAQAAADPGISSTASSAYPSASAGGPSSPSPPANPPNTPALPVSPPV